MGIELTKRWWLAEEWDGLTFCWDLWYACNYRCSYRWWESRQLWDKLALEHKLLSAEEWINAWDRIFDSHGTARIDLLGGEPTNYPDFDKLLSGLLKKHYVLLATNLSLSIERLTVLLQSVPLDRLRISASFHPQFAEPEAFLERLSLIESRARVSWATIVAWPPFLPRLKAWKSMFEARGHAMVVQVFQGPWAGRIYPEAYTPQERELIGAFITKDEKRQRLSRPSPKGRLCGAGHVYVTVKANGDVFRCSAAAEAEPMGNLLEPGFRLGDRPEPCSFERCSCREFLYQWDLYGRRRGAA